MDTPTDSYVATIMCSAHRGPAPEGEWQYRRSLTGILTPICDACWPQVEADREVLRRRAEWEAKQAAAELLRIASESPLMQAVERVRRERARASREQLPASPPPPAAP